MTVTPEGLGFDVPPDTALIREGAGNLRVNAQAATDAYIALQGQIVTAKNQDRLGFSADLNTVTAPGSYYQPLGPSGTLHYPVPVPGHLEVEAGSGLGFVLQRYTLMDGSATYVRTLAGSTWSTWEQLAKASDIGTSVTVVREAVASSSALPTTGNEAGDVRLTEDTGHLWLWDGTAWVDTGPAGAAGLVESTTYPGLYTIGA